MVMFMLNLNFMINHCTPETIPREDCQSISLNLFCDKFFDITLKVIYFTISIIID